MIARRVPANTSSAPSRSQTEKTLAPTLHCAEAVTIQKQDVEEFDSLLARALAINPDATPDTRLLNLIMQRRARWLLSRKADLFLIENDQNAPDEKPQQPQNTLR